jgi:hypothetical protein
MVDMLTSGTSADAQWVRDVAAGKYNSWDDNVHNFFVQTKAFLVALVLLLVAAVLTYRVKQREQGSGTT